jgi:hypothetical protein
MRFAILDQQRFEVQLRAVLETQCRLAAAGAQPRRRLEPAGPAAGRAHPVERHEPHREARLGAEPLGRQRLEVEGHGVGAHPGQPPHRDPKLEQPGGRRGALDRELDQLRHDRGLVHERS